MSAYPTDWSIAYDLFFPWLFFLLPVLGAVLLALKTGWWRHARWRRLLLVGALPLAILLLAGLCLSAWAARVGAPQITIRAERVHCAPWPESVAWKDIAKVTGRSEKMKSGWREVGMWLTLRSDGAARFPPPDPAFDHAWYRLAVRLWRGDPLVQIDREAGSPRNLYCRLTGLDVSLNRLYRTAQEMIWAHQAIASHYPGHEPAIAWCESDGRTLTWECASNAIRHHRDCRDRPEPPSYDECRAKFWRPRP